jgi:AhpD family alkylhydroperoxidase
VVTIQVFDPALCCSTGVCGVEVDQRLVDFGADVDWLKKQGASVERFNLAQQPMAFADHAAIRQLLETQGETALPAIVVNGSIKQSGGYPSRDQLAAWAGIAKATSIFTDQVAELVAIGAAIASNCEPCFNFHFEQARKLGVTDADMRRAVDLAKRVKDTPARAVLDLASRTLDTKAPLAAVTVVAVSSPKSKSSCCGPGPGQAASSASKCC